MSAQVRRIIPGNLKFRYMVEVASVYNVRPDDYDNETNVNKRIVHCQPEINGDYAIKEKRGLFYYNHLLFG